MSDVIQIIRDFLAAQQKVKFAYLFGSVARGEAGPLSDVDLAVYVDGRLDKFTYRLKLMEALSVSLKSENFDLIILNNAPIVLTHEIISGGIVLKDDRRRRVMFESRTLRQYLDTAYLRDVQRGYLRDQIRRGGFFG